MSEAPVPSGYRQRPDYRVDLLARTNAMTATLGSRQLAASDACLVVDEQDHGLVVYFPRDSVDLTQLETVDLHSVCPFKGEASYWTVPGSERPWIAWTYPRPHPPVAALADYIAFDQSVVAVTVGAGRYTGVRS
ncbi:DUF427 domain-containing protein [Nocardia sp. NPDC001965]